MKIVPSEYSELSSLVWNRDPTHPIDEETAYAIYWRNWRFVNVTLLEDNEKELLKFLEIDYCQTDDQ